MKRPASRKFYAYETRVVIHPHRLQRRGRTGTSSTQTPALVTKRNCREQGNGIHFPRICRPDQHCIKASAQSRRYAPAIRTVQVRNIRDARPVERRTLRRRPSHDDRQQHRNKPADRVAGGATRGPSVVASNRDRPSPVASNRRPSGRRRSAHDPEPGLPRRPLRAGPPGWRSARGARERLPGLGWYMQYFLVAIWLHFGITDRVVFSLKTD